MTDVEMKTNSQRYERLRILGVAPYGSRHLENGEVMRFTNLDEFVDKDLEWAPSRGEAKPLPRKAWLVEWKSGDTTTYYDEPPEPRESMKSVTPIKDDQT